MQREAAAPAPADIASWILDSASRSPTVQAALAACTADAPAPIVSGLAGSLQAAFDALLARAGARPAIVALAHDEDAAEALRGDLAALLETSAVTYLPARDVPPLSDRPTHALVEAQRIEALAALAGGRVRVLVTTPAALQTRVPSPERMREGVLRCAVGADMEMDLLTATLVDLGYARQPVVEEVGTFARRGAIIDVFSFGLTDPVRIEFDGDTVHSLRTFSVETQRSVARLEAVSILPRREVVTNPTRLRGAEERVRAAAEAATGDAADALVSLAELFADAVQPDAPGADTLTRWAHLLDQDLVLPLAYLPESALVVVHGATRATESAEKYWREVRDAHAELHEAFHPLGGPDALSAPPEELHAALSRFRCVSTEQLDVRATQQPSTATALVAVDETTPHVRIPGREQESMARDMPRLRTYLSQLDERSIAAAILCESTGQLERLKELLPDTTALLALGTLSAGFSLLDAQLAVLTDHQIFARVWRRRDRRRPRAGLSIAALQALTPGDFLVHVDHGIGVFRGMERLTLNGQETDCLRIDYAGSDRLYLPIDQLHLVQRYVADDSRAPALSKLGGTAWAKTKARAKKAIRDMADQLIKTYAARSARDGHAFAADTVWQSELESSFPYEETPDQDRAIEDVKRDMESTRAMDRLICGDVGFGKTEVAVRAAFKAVMDGRQVAVLVPTTILAEQHGATFAERLAGLPVSIEVLSRFRSTAEQKEIVRKIAAGEVDVVIGTHRLLSKDIVFRNLGLVVIDEEHRFGVRHKERIRTMRELADVLTLTATPIPRTLHMSLLGARDMSVIETPPRNRLPIHTEVIEWDDGVVVDALLREADRGGQAFVIHNRIETLASKAEDIQKLVPSLRLGVAHGQMTPRALENVMHDFLHRRYDVLVCTMIVESGLDIPNANTMVVDRSEMFGLAELYQLRGRIGRSSERAYAYLMVPRSRVLTETAEKRLRVLEEYGDLGAGFKIAMRDLEIRGAGNLLGPEQHGFIVSVGFDLYCKLLEEAVHEARGETGEGEVDTRLATDVTAYLPEDLVPDEKDRLALYKRLADARDVGQVQRIEDEVRDRFGAIDGPAANLIALRRLRAEARAARVRVLTVRTTLVEAEMAGEITRPMVEALTRSLTSAWPVEFEIGTRHAVRIPLRGAHRSPTAPLEAGAALLRVLRDFATVRPLEPTASGGSTATIR